MTNEEILEKLKTVLAKDFEVEEDDVTLDASLSDDLDLDSIDAIDLIVKMKEYAPEGSPALDPAKFKTAKKVSNVIDILAESWGN